MIDPTRAALAGRWEHRAGLELDAALRFERLAARMGQIGARPDLIGIARAAEAQELAHVRLCLDLAERFGARAELSAPPEPEEVAPAHWRLPDRVLYEVVAFCCVCETSNAAMVSSGIGDIEDGPTRRASRTILADEVHHSRLGWRYLAAHPPGRSARAWLSTYLPDMLAGTARSSSEPPTAAPEDEEEARRFGLPPLADRRAAFFGSMRDVVLSGLERFGVDVAPASAWLNRVFRDPSPIGECARR